MVHHVIFVSKEGDERAGDKNLEEDGPQEKYSKQRHEQNSNRRS